jgi:hypothetical protein
VAIVNSSTAAVFLAPQATGQIIDATISPAVNDILSIPAKGAAEVVRVDATKWYVRSSKGTLAFATPVTPVINSSLAISAYINTAFSYQITATNSPTAYNATGFPAGLSINTATGLISGTPTVAATSNVTISATNGAGSGSATLVLTLTANPYLTGDRLSIITPSASADLLANLAARSSVNAWVDGSLAIAGPNSWEPTAATPITTSTFLRYNLAVAQKFTSAKIQCDRAFNAGIWVWQGSNDSGTNWTDVSAQFTLASATSPFLSTAALTPTIAYSAYRMRGVSGSFDAAPYYQELEFTI